MVLLKVLHDLEKWKTSISIYFSSLLIVFWVENCITSPPHATSAMLDRTTRWHEIPAEFWSTLIFSLPREFTSLGRRGRREPDDNLLSSESTFQQILMAFGVLLPIHKCHGLTRLKGNLRSGEMSYFQVHPPSLSLDLDGLGKVILDIGTNTTNDMKKWIPAWNNRNSLREFQITVSLQIQKTSLVCLTVESVQKKAVRFNLEQKS